MPSSDIPPAFCAVLPHANVLISLLRAIRVNERPKCIITATVSGLKATCENSRVMQGSAILPKSLFRSFDLRQEDIAAKVNLEILLKCIGSGAIEPDAVPNVSFHSSAPQYSVSEDVSLKLTIQDSDSDLEIEVTDGDVTTTLTMGNEEGGFELFPDVPDEELTAKLSLPSQFFGEMWLEFDQYSEELGIRVDREKFRIFFHSTAGRSELMIGDQDEEVQYEYLSELDHHSYLFRMALLKETLESLCLSKRTIITTSETNTSFRYQIPVDADGAFADIEYLITAKYTGDEDPYPEVDPLESLLDLSDLLPAGADHNTVAGGDETAGQEMLTDEDETPILPSASHADNGEDLFDDDAF